MMLTDDAVEAALAALRTSTAHEPTPPTQPPSNGARTPVAGDVLQRVASAPIDRTGELARARAWLDEGRVPDGAFVAKALVGRLVCDRLREAVA